MSAEPAPRRRICRTRRRAVEWREALELIDRLRERAPWRQAANRQREQQLIPPHLLAARVSRSAADVACPKAARDRHEQDRPIEPRLRATTASSPAATTRSRRSRTRPRSPAARPSRSRGRSTAPRSGTGGRRDRRLRAALRGRSRSASASTCTAPLEDEVTHHRNPAHGGDAVLCRRRAATSPTTRRPRRRQPRAAWRLRRTAARRCRAPRSRAIASESIARRQESLPYPQPRCPGDHDRRQLE